MKSLENKKLWLKNKSTISTNFAKKVKSKSANYGNYTHTKKKFTKNLEQKEEDCETCDGHNSDC